MSWSTYQPGGRGAPGVLLDGDFENTRLWPAYPMEFTPTCGPPGSWFGLAIIELFLYKKRYIYDRSPANRLVRFF